MSHAISKSVLNPIAAPLAVMRSSLIGGLVQVLRHNLTRKAPRVRVFETGRVFLRDPAAPDGERAVAGLRQPTRIAALAWGPVDPLQWGRAERAVDFHDAKGDLEALLAPRHARFVADAHPALHPGRCARVELDGRAVGHIGELHPRWRRSYDLPSAPVVFELALDAVLERPVPEADPLPRQQPVWRDVALVVGDRVSHDALIDVLANDADGLVRSVTLFDIYRPAQAGAGLAPGERSLALRLELLDPQTTLTEPRIDAAVAAARARAAAAFDARLRR
jgi:phenylalanyl-tRNA synthetase beta chain